MAIHELSFKRDKRTDHPSLVACLASPTDAASTETTDGTGTPERDGSGCSLDGTPLTASKKQKTVPADPSAPAIAPPSRKVMPWTPDDSGRKKDMLGSTRALYDKMRFEESFDHGSFVASLKPAYREIYSCNPHMRQVFVGGYDFHHCHHPLSMADRVISDRSGRTLRRGRGREVKTVEHWGQRKLLLSEIEFLTLFYERELTVVYAGAAPGKHINFMAEALFPKMRFILIDPRDFDAWNTRRVTIRQEYFTDEMAREYADTRTIFISDVRVNEAAKMDQDVREEAQLNDMYLQQGWARLLRPIATMLKFVLPYNHERYPKVSPSQVERRHMVLLPSMAAGAPFVLPQCRPPCPHHLLLCSPPPPLIGRLPLWLNQLYAYHLHSLEEEAK